MNPNDPPAQPHQGGHTIFPSLLRGSRGGPSAAGRPLAAPQDARSLLDIMFDGFYLIFLLRNGSVPSDTDIFRTRLKEFLAAMEKGAQRIGAHPEDIHLSKHAFCALADEVLLAPGSTVAEQWQVMPLQLELFGDHLAGETFFDRLETMRAHGATKLQVLEVYHMCLLLGFQGKYLTEGTEKLGYLTARLSDEIALHKGRSGSRQAAFAPHALAPDRIRHQLRAEVPLWAMASVLALATLLAYLGLRWLLDRQTRNDLAPYAQLIKMPAQQPQVTITLP